ncbi:DUF1932 domain-containing protein [Pseudahrensia aquimaris]|uniref:DUF1932 domain-containing protein n=1 Tax=Pseudahrensia aquimaris TaxID=744461 RepID=A0ABW3FF83_9HYPH
MNSDVKIAFLGFGEAAQAFALGLREAEPGLAIKAFDIKTDAAKKADYARLNVRGLDTASQICKDVDVIFSLVTADQAEIAASQLASENLDNILFLDCNSCSPKSKRRSAKLIAQAGGRYVDVAVMTPVHPRLHKSPCLLAGPSAHVAREMMASLGMNAEVAGDEIGAASTRKMIRSVMIKGLEALTLECFLAARKAGIEDDIITSLEASFPGFDWAHRAPYMIERTVTHGIRRAAEMEEVAQTLRDLGISPHSTAGTVLRQREVGELGLDAAAIGTDDLGALSDAIDAGLAMKSI